MTNGTNNLLQKFWVNVNKILSAEANFLFLKQKAELAMIVTSYNMTNCTRYFLQKFWVNLTKIVSVEANFLFLKQLTELAMIVTS